MTEDHSGAATVCATRIWPWHPFVVCVGRERRSVSPNPRREFRRLYRERDAMSWRGVVVVLILIGSVLLGPIAMAYAGCCVMGAMCGRPCGMACAIFSPTVALAPVSSAALYIVPGAHRHLNVFAGLELPPRSPFLSA